MSCGNCKKECGVRFIPNEGKPGSGRIFEVRCGKENELGGCPSLGFNEILRYQRANSRGAEPRIQPVGINPLTGEKIFPPLKQY